MTHAAVLHTEQPDQYQTVCDGEWVPMCHTGKGKHDDVCVDNRWEFRPELGKRTPCAYRVYGPLRKGETLHAYTSVCGNHESHTKLHTYYQGTLPLKRISPIKGMSPARNDRICSGQAIPDSMIRKLAIMAGRPEIAP